MHRIDKPFHCPVEATLSLIGGKYKMIILYHLLEDRVLRYNQIQKYIPQATAKMLTQQLRELEADGLIHREVYPVVPPKTEYSLTERGKSLEPVIYSVCDWAYYVTSVIAFGKARIVEDPSVVYEKVKAIGNKYYPSAEDVDAELER